jgi:hypothetical protein
MSPASRTADSRAGCRGGGPHSRRLCVGARLSRCRPALFGHTPLASPFRRTGQFALSGWAAESRVRLPRVSDETVGSTSGSTATPVRATAITTTTAVCSPRFLPNQRFAPGLNARDQLPLQRRRSCDRSLPGRNFASGPPRGWLSAGGTRNATGSGETAGATAPRCPLSRWC